MYIKHNETEGNIADSIVFKPHAERKRCVQCRDTTTRGQTKQTRASLQLL